MTKYKVVIAEDQTMPRQLLELIINGSDRFLLSKSFENADMAAIFCSRNDVDIVLMDVLTANGSNGFDAGMRIKQANPDTKIVIITSMPEVSWIQKAKESGFDGFWYKELMSSSFLDFMEKIMKGERIYPDHTPILPIGSINSNELSEREWDVLREMTGGFTNDEIAEHLSIGKATVKTHIQNILNKTGFRNRTELAVKARESGLAIYKKE